MQQSESSVNLFSRASQSYELVDKKADSNAFLQGVSGFFGAAATIPTDVAVIPVIYGAMWNDIRDIYGHGPLQDGDVKTVISQILPEVVSDIAFDKVLGLVPVVGVYFNAICAKAMTWRLGTLFTFMSARGSEIPENRTKEAMILIRHMFPQKDMFTFSTPVRKTFVQLVESVEGDAIHDFENKVMKALEFLSAPGKGD